MSSKLFQFIVIFMGFCAFAQEGNLKGIVIDENGIPVTGVVIVIEQLNRQIYTDSQGKFYYQTIPVGVYNIRTQYLGYGAVVKELKIRSNVTISVVLEIIPEPIVLNNIIVKASLVNQIKGLNIQRSKQNISNVVSIDQIGKYPDANVGDAMKRITGINIQVDQGEARDIIIRGLAPELNSITINGSRIPSAEGDNRNIQLDLIPSDMIQLIEVNKALTPDMEADALGGSVNLITRSTPEGFRLSATMGSGINSIDNKRIWNGHVLIGNRSKNGKFGWMFSGSINDNDFGSDNIEAEWSNEINYNSGLVDEDNEPILEHMIVNPYPVILEQQTYFIQRIRRSFAANFDYRLSENHELFLKTLYNWRDDWENRFVFEHEVLQGEDFLVNDYTIEEGNLIGFPGEISRQSRGGIDTRRGKNARLEDQRVQNYSLGGVHYIRKIKIDWLTSYARAGEKSFNERIAEYKAFVPVNNLTTNLKFPLLQSVNVSDESNLTNFFYDEIVEENKKTKEEDVNLVIDASIPWNLFNTKSGKIKLGVLTRFKHKERSNNFFMFDFSAEFPTLADTPTRNYSDSDFLVGSQYQVGRFVDVDWLGGIILANGELVPGEFLRQNYSFDENVYSTYWMTEQYITNKLSTVSGIRVEHTSIESKANFIEDIDNVSKRNEHQNYTNIMPSVHFKYSLNENFILRLGWGNTISRPNYTDLIPTLEIVNADREIFLGNPNLDPTRSMNFDLMGEYYFKSLGIISGGLFFKHIKGFVYTFKSQNNDPSFGVGTLGYDLFQPLNGDEATLFGIEFSFQRGLNFLPGILRNLSLTGNYTFLSSQTDGIRNQDGIERRDLDLPKTAKHSYNIALGYDDGVINSRLALNFSGNYLDEIGGNNFQDIYYDNQLFLDFNINIKIKEHFSLYASVNNIINRPLRRYQGISLRTVQDEYYERRFAFGLKYDFFKRRK